ncbi:dihydrolipoyl dehydrogenase family protein [Sinisalibacter aestuarii]|uniref:Dihydrolipoamide dehydrogenase n=1 Tax=Sinisalibacter aestuarii TaxID=2949426 RepID=A0ABQ5LVZ3_9RHOB|nr:FAD-dependent oxidoreductase [Sinisalibacter aestuarii]GKY89164.1 dihydrolipoamide dehydrogenase [Sinisalibacter aestuarii]
MSVTKTDICVIGAGSGGLSVAAGAVQMGARVVLIEAGEMGGDCLNTGCVPSKALLHAACAGMDWQDAHDHVRATIAAIAPHDSVERFEGLGVRVIKGFARFTGPREVAVNGETIRARRIVIATGSRPRLPAIAGLEDVPCLTNETIFALAERPEHLLILGAGAVGLEMAEAHRRLGCEVTVLEAARAMGRDDPEAVAVVLAALRARGVRIEEDMPVVRAQGGDGRITLTTADGARITGSHLLVATGRAPAIEGLDLDKAGVEAGSGGIVVDTRLRSTNRRIHAIGDVTGGAQFTHVAGYQAGVIIRAMLFGLPAKARADHIPHALYTAPELAQVGLTEAEARARYGDGVEIARAAFSGNDRAVATGETAGFLKVMVHKGRPVGATLVGAGAGEQIALWALALSGRQKLSAIAGIVVPYPTMAEISKRAAGVYFAPRLFDNKTVKRVVRAVQTILP